MASAKPTPTIVALVPMKHTSVRVRGKNYRMFQGQPLCYWVLKTLRACPQITQIVVDTDSKQIMEMIAQDFPTVEQAANSDLHVPPIVLLDRYATSFSPFVSYFSRIFSHFPQFLSQLSHVYLIFHSPAELLDDPPMNEILLHDTSVFPADFYLQVQPADRC